MRRPTRSTVVLALVGISLIGSATPSAEAGGKLFRRRERVVVETVAVPRPQDQLAPSPMLGSFRPTPYITVHDNGLIGGLYGREQSLTVYGPLSAFRQVSAPVNTIVRGYDGVPTLVQGTSFSNPNQPALSPFIYPTRASNYSALKFQSTPPQLDKGTMWVDLN
jgi:hypothetical protein